MPISCMAGDKNKKVITITHSGLIKPVIGHVLLQD